MTASIGKVTEETITKGEMIRAKMRVKVKVEVEGVVRETMQKVKKEAGVEVVDREEAARRMIDHQDNMEMTKRGEETTNRGEVVVVDATIRDVMMQLVGALLAKMVKIEVQRYNTRQ